MESDGGGGQYHKGFGAKRWVKRQAERQLIQWGDRPDKPAFNNSTDWDPEDKVRDGGDKDHVTRQIATNKPRIRADDDGLNRRQDKHAGTAERKVLVFLKSRVTTFTYKLDDMEAIEESFDANRREHHGEDEQLLDDFEWLSYLWGLMGHRNPQQSKANLKIINLQG